LGKKYNLVTPFTSLIVLERVEQYVEHGIQPPASLPELRKQYARLKDEQSASARKEEKNRLDHILALWDKRVEWWNQKFKYPANFKYHGRDEGEGGGISHRPVGVSRLQG